MSRKLPPDVKPNFLYRNPMAMRPKLAVKIGTLCFEWARMEQSLAIVFSWLLDAAPESLFETEILERVESVRGKTSLLYALCEHRLDDESLLTAFRKGLDKVERLAGQRNKYVHGRWAIADFYPDELVLMRWLGPKMIDGALLIGAEDLERLLAEVRNHATWLHQFFDSKVRPALKPKPV